MSSEFTVAFEKLWVSLRERWCNSHNLGGALAFSYDLKMVFFHRVVQVDVENTRVDELIDDALHHFLQKDFDCVFTLSPLDRPNDFGKRLLRRGFKQGLLASAMVYDHHPISPAPISPVAEITKIDQDHFEIWSDLMCRNFDFPLAMVEAGRSWSTEPDLEHYIASTNGTAVGTALLYSQNGMGYIDLVGTLPEFRRRGIASGLVLRAIADPQAAGNRWTALEAETGTYAEQLYERLGFRTIYHRYRYTKSLDNESQEI